MTTLINDPATGTDEQGSPRHDQQVVIELDSVAVLSYAFAHNGVPVVRQAFVTNSTGRPIEGVRLEIEITTVDGVLNRPYVNEIGMLETGLTPISTVGLRLDPHGSRTLRSSGPVRSVHG